MKLQDLRNSLEAGSIINDQLVHYLSGDIEFIDDSRFKLYPNPNNRSMYLILNQTAVQEDIYEWSELEIATQGLSGHKVYRVSVPYGTEVQIIKVQTHKIGKTLSAEFFPKALSGTCQNTTGCSAQKCCTTGSDGECYCDNCCIA